ncbi:MAG: 2-oxo acid dehydrogenase subunit E2 [Myxococcota bacterium]|nr:2-oxo acid dehydrogenase subunit E2 [Myxococcota bacterium]
MPNVALTRLNKVSPFRKVAIGTWRTAYDPTVYGTMEIRMEEAERYIEAYRAAKGERLTVTHLVTAALGRALRKNPEANGILRFNRIYLRDAVDVGVLVLADDPQTGEVDLSSAVVRGADEASLAEQIVQLNEQVSNIRAGNDAAMKQSKDTIRMVPFFFMNAFMKILSLLLYTLNLDLRWAGLPRDPFGGAVVTSIGSLGLDTAYVPLVPYTRVPIFVAPGAVKSVPVVGEGDVIEVGRVMGVHASFDHRFIDGGHAASLTRDFRRVMEHPFEELDPLD